ncbi:MAG: hypothetical protein WDW36_008913 [Sanguina aurantia]
MHQQQHAEQRDNFEGGSWQKRSYKAKSEGQVLSCDIFPAAPVTNASAASQITGAMFAFHCPRTPAARRHPVPSHALRDHTLHHSQLVCSQAQARCALVHSTLVSLESYCRSSAPHHLSLASKQLSNVSSNSPSATTATNAAGHYSASSGRGQGGQWGEGPAPHLRHSTQTQQHRFFVQSHRLLGNASSGQQMPQVASSAHLAAALEGLFLTPAHGLDLDVGFQVRNLHTQLPPGTELLISVNGQVYVSMFDACQGAWVANQLDTHPSDVPQILNTSLIALVSPPLTPASKPPAATAIHPRPPPTPAADAPHPHATQPPALSSAPPAEGPRTFRMQVTTIISSSSGSSLQLQPHVTIICNGVRHLVTSQAVLPPAPPPQPAVMVAAKLQPPLEGSTQRKHKFLDLDWESSKFRPSTRTGIEVSFSSAALPSNGLLMVECRLGRLLSNSRPVVLTDDPAFAAELSQLLPEMLAELRFSQGSGWCCRSVHDTLLIDIGCWLAFQSTLATTGVTTATTTTPAAAPHHPARPASISLAVVLQPAPPLPRAHHPSAGEREAAHQALAARVYRTPAARSYMAQSGLGLLEVAVGRGWTHVAGTLLRGLHRIDTTLPPDRVPRQLRPRAEAGPPASPADPPRDHATALSTSTPNYAGLAGRDAAVRPRGGARQPGERHEVTFQTLGEVSSRPAAVRAPGGGAPKRAASLHTLVLPHGREAGPGAGVQRGSAPARSGGGWVRCPASQSAPVNSTCAPELDSGSCAPSFSAQLHPFQPPPHPAHAGPPAQQAAANQAFQDLDQAAHPHHRASHPRPAPDIAAALEPAAAHPVGLSRPPAHATATHPAASHPLPAALWNNSSTTNNNNINHININNNNNSHINNSNNSHINNSNNNTNNTNTNNIIITTNNNNNTTITTNNNNSNNNSSGSAAAVMHEVPHGVTGGGPLSATKGLLRTKSWLSRSLTISHAPSPPGLTSVAAPPNPALLAEEPPSWAFPESPCVSGGTNASDAPHHHHHHHHHHPVPSLLTHAAALLQHHPTHLTFPSTDVSSNFSGPVLVAMTLSPPRSQTSLNSSTSHHTHSSQDQLAAAPRHPTAAAPQHPTRGSGIVPPPRASHGGRTPPGRGTDGPSALSAAALACRPTPAQRRLANRPQHPSASTSAGSGIATVICSGPALSLGSLLQLYQDPDLRSGSGSSWSPGPPHPRPQLPPHEAYQLFVSLCTAPQLQAWFIVVFGTLVGLLDYAIRMDRVRGPVQILPYLACHCLCALWLLSGRASFMAQRENILSALVVTRVVCLSLLPLSMGRQQMALLQVPVWSSGSLAAAALAQAGYASYLLLPLVFEQVRARRALLLSACQAAASILALTYAQPSQQSAAAIAAVLFWNLTAAAVAAALDARHRAAFLSAQSLAPMLAAAQHRHRL